MDFMARSAWHEIHYENQRVLVSLSIILIIKIII